MTSKAALFALLALWGVGPCWTVPALAEELSATEDSAGEEGASSRVGEVPLRRSFTNRVWVKLDDGDMPGVSRIFLSDGTLVQDSCWETYRLSKWSMTGETELSWNEDGMDIAASIVSVDSSSLHLQLKLGADLLDERYTAATVPYTCPDMPKA